MAGKSCRDDLSEIVFNRAPKIAIKFQATGINGLTPTIVTLVAFLLFSFRAGFPMCLVL